MQKSLVPFQNRQLIQRAATVLKLTYYQSATGDQADSVTVALLCLAHQRVTRAVGYYWNTMQ